MSSEESMGLEFSKWTLVVLETRWESGHWKELDCNEKEGPVNEM